jgi:hypothetical protein
MGKEERLLQRDQAAAHFMGLDSTAGISDYDLSTRRSQGLS